MPNFDNNNGFGNSDLFTFTIPDTEDGSTVTPIDLIRHYAFFLVRCADVSNVAAGTDTLSFQIGITAADDMLRLEDENEEILITMDDTFQRVIFAGMARRIRPVLSAVASGGTVVIEIYGIDAATLV